MKTRIRFEIEIEVVDERALRQAARVALLEQGDRSMADKVLSPKTPLDLCAYALFHKASAEGAYKVVASYYAEEI